MEEMKDIKKDTKKSIKIILLIISTILIITTGTLAAFTWASEENTQITMTVEKNVKVVFETGNDISTDELAPVLDYNDGKYTTFNITNESEDQYITDIIININSIDSKLQNELFKYVVLESTDNNDFEIISEGTFNDLKIGNNRITKLELQPLAKTYYKFIMYIDGSKENDINMMNKSISGYLTVEATYTEPNAPIIENSSLIPVMYNNNNTWVKADETNEDETYKWYDYESKQWANAVLVKENKYSSVVSESDKSVSIDNSLIDVYANTNKGIDSSMSSSTFTFTTGDTEGELSFDYSVSSEEGCDALNISINDTNVITDYSGNKNSSYSQILEANTEYIITVEYTKDSSYYEYDDEATISNIILPEGSSELVIEAVGDYGWEQKYGVVSYSNFNVLDSGIYELTESDDISSSDSIGRYVCSDLSSTKCDEIYLIKTAEDNTITSVDVYNTKMTENVRSNYFASSIGTEVKEEDILGYFVWIPRYKYRVWNINKDIGIDSYKARESGIDIIFEKNTQITGTINCSYDFSVLEDEGNAESCNGSNNEFYTHPAFWWDENGDGNREETEELEGIWVAKFKMSPEPNGECQPGEYDDCININDEPRIKPNADIWLYNKIGNYSEVIQKMNDDNNSYGLMDNIDSHMMKNMEWGATFYLTHSKYGICTNGACDKVRINENSHVTGCGPQSEGNTDYNACNDYTTQLGQSASTTGNIYGIYDMNTDQTFEYVMANMSSSIGSYTFSSDEMADNFNYSSSTAKYIDTYTFGYSPTSYNRTRLGDATGEIIVESGIEWNNSYGNLFFDSYISTYGGGTDNGYWLMRGNYEISQYVYNNIGAFAESSARPVLIFE